MVRKEKSADITVEGRVFETNILCGKGTGKKKSGDISKGTGRRKGITLDFPERVKNDRKQGYKDGAGKKSRQYQEWGKRRKSCIFSVSRRKGRYGRHGKR